MCIIAADDDEEEDALARLSIDRLVRFEGGIFVWDSDGYYCINWLLLYSLEIN